MLGIISYLMYQAFFFYIIIKNCKKIESLFCCHNKEIHKILLTVLPKYLYLCINVYEPSKPTGRKSWSVKK